MAKVSFTCCFCGSEIEEDKRIDPSAVSIFGKFLNNKHPEQNEQMFFCHYKCFKDAVQPQFSAYMTLDQD